jgi:hypothetical protein
MMRFVPNCSLTKVFHAAALAVALCAAPASQAGVLDFETPVDAPYVFAGDVLSMGKYYVEGIGLDGLVGSVNNNDTCLGVQCPVNNPTTYYSAYADNYFSFGMLDHSAFSIASIDASFIGAGANNYASVAGLLYIAGYNAAGLVSDIYLDLGGPVNGSFNFASYDLSGFGAGMLFTDVLVAAYACDASGNCNRSTNQANFAVDNIVTVNASDVPEPGTFALLGLGLLGLAGARRRAA